MGLERTESAATNECLAPPAAWLEATPAAEECLIAELNPKNGMFWACIDGLLGTEGNPAAGSLPQCNADKRRVRRFFEERDE